MPVYLAANQSLKNLVRKFDGVVGPTMNGLESDVHAHAYDCPSVNITTTTSSTTNMCSWAQTVVNKLRTFGIGALQAMLRAEEQRQQLIDDTH